MLPDPTWQGPDPLITWGRGYASVLTPTGPVWIPSRCVRPAHHELASDAAKPDTEFPAEHAGERGPRKESAAQPRQILALGVTSKH